MPITTRAFVLLALCSAAIVATVGVRAAVERTAQRDDTTNVDALVARGDYLRAEAIARANLDRVSDATGHDSLEVAAALDSFVGVLLVNGKGSLPATIALAERALAIRESRSPASSTERATSLINLGNALGAAAAHGRAISLLERAVAMRQRDGPEGLPLARALDALGAELVRAGRHGDALAPLERSLASTEAVPGAGIDLVVTLDHIALALQRKGDYAAARAALDRALGLQAQSQNHPVHVETLTLLGQQLWFEGSWIEARAASARAVDLAERTLPPDHPATALSLRFLAATMLDLGYLAQAKTLQERALGMIERTLGSTHPENSAYLNGLGDSNALAGDYPAARALYEKALAIAVARLGAQHTWIAGLHHNLALVDARLGDYASARQRQARAIAIWERALGRDHPTVALALMQLAAVQREQGAAAEALPLLERALGIRERRLGSTHRDVARTLSDLSATLIQLGRPERAQTLATRALRILDSVDAPDAPDLATVLDLYGQLQARHGDTQAARLYFDRALAIREKIFGSSHPAVADTQARLALTLARLDQAQLAFRIAQSAEATGREHLRLMLRYLPERQSLNYAATRPRGLDLMLSLTGSLPGADMIGLDEVIRSRALVLDEMATRRNSLLSSGQTGPLASELTRARQRLVNLVVRGPGELGPTRYAALIGEARRDSERAERVLAERSATFSTELERTQIGLREVQAALPAGSALVSFIRYERTTVGAGAGAAASGPLPRDVVTSSYLAFVLKPGESPTAIALGPVDTIDARVSTWRTAIAAEPGAPAGRSGAPAASSRTPGLALRRLIWDPVAAAVNGSHDVFIVPDGTLSLVPFSALPVGQSSYLVEEGPVIHYVSAERDLASFSGAPSRPRQGLLAMGGPAFDDRTLFGARANGPAIPDARPPSAFRSATTECESLQQITFPRLEGALREVQELAKLWSVPATSDVRVLVGREASERTFKEEASHYRVLHLATHGFFLGESCDRKPGRRSTRAVGGLTTGRTRDTELNRENPLLLSGLALAGANRRAAARPDEDDGILTAEEVASLNLAGVEWAVLSACGTGLGEIKAGEGVFGLRRAFQIAGAHTVIMSLWSVDDQATRAWMRALYEGRFQKGLDTAHAVNAASLAMLRERRARGQSTLPFYWAAFVAAGDWR